MGKNSLSKSDALQPDVLAPDGSLGESLGEVVGKLQLLVVSCGGEQRVVYFLWSEYTLVVWEITFS